MEILLKSVQKKFVSEKGRELEVLKKVRETINNEEFVVLIGPSGCGKSTLLNIIAGLEKCTSGEVIVGGKKIINPSRDRGMVFQQDALLMWRKVLDNVEYGLELSLSPCITNAAVPDTIGADILVPPNIPNGSCL